MSRKASVVEFVCPYTSATHASVAATAEEHILDAMRAVHTKGFDTSVLEITINDDVENNQIVLRISGKRKVLKLFAASIELSKGLNMSGPMWAYSRRISSNSEKEARFANTVRVRRIKRRGSAGYQAEAAGGSKYSPGSSSNSVRAHSPKVNVKRTGRARQGKTTRRIRAERERNAIQRNMEAAGFSKQDAQAEAEDAFRQIMSAPQSD